MNVGTNLGRKWPSSAALPVQTSISVALSAPTPQRPRIQGTPWTPILMLGAMSVEMMRRCSDAQE
jgi:hypothetical protein